MNLLPEAKPSAPLITLLNSNKRRIENMDQIHAQLQDRFPDATFNCLESSSIEKLSIREQVMDLLLCAASVFLPFLPC